MGKRRIIAETGAGQHGVATATAAALLGLECTVYMGEEDMRRQALNVFRMRLLGAEVRPASSGSRTLKDAVNEAMRDWVATVEDTHYFLGSVMGPHPYPWMVREFQRVIGDEARAAVSSTVSAADPDVVVACVGGGSNAIGIFAGFADREAGSSGSSRPAVPPSARGVPGRRARHARRSCCRTSSGRCARLSRSRPDSTIRASGPSTPTSRPPAGPDTSRSPTTEVSRRSSCSARTEGIIPALEVGPRDRLGAGASGEDSLADKTVLVNLSGRGDKDVAQVMDILEPGP